MSLIATFDTTQGPIKVELFADKAPLTVANFVNLVKHGFYDGLIFHRVIADFPFAPSARRISAITSAESLFLSKILNFARTHYHMIDRSKKP